MTILRPISDHVFSSADLRRLCGPALSSTLSMLPRSSRILDQQLLNLRLVEVPVHRAEFSAERGIVPAEPTEMAAVGRPGGQVLVDDHASVADVILAGPEPAPQIASVTTNARS